MGNRRSDMVGWVRCVFVYRKKCVGQEEREKGSAGAIIPEIGEFYVHAIMLKIYNQQTGLLLTFVGREINYGEN